MDVSPQPPSVANNLLLASLPRRVKNQLLPHLRPVSLSFQQVLYEPSRTIRHVYFPTGGMISLLLVLEDGAAAEVGRVGNEGMLGLPVFLGVRTSHTRACVEIPGQALRMPADVFREQVRQGGPLADQLLRYTQALLEHTSVLTACNNRHSIEQRLCRWLLLAQDRVATSRFELTQEFLSEMLGTHRESITVIAGGLQKAGLICYGRGKLAILDRRGLEAVSCACYREMNSAYRWLHGQEAAR